MTNSNDRTSSSGIYVPRRYILVALSCLGFANIYALRVNLSVALVAMVNSTFANANSEYKSHECEVNRTSVEEV